MSCENYDKLTWNYFRNAEKLYERSLRSWVFTARTTSGRGPEIICFFTAKVVRPNSAAHVYIKIYILVCIISYIYMYIYPIYSKYIYIYVLSRMEKLQRSGVQQLSEQETTSLGIMQTNWGPPPNSQALQHYDSQLTFLYGKRRCMYIFPVWEIIYIFLYIYTHIFIYYKTFIFRLLYWL